jgi:hypothetical protein
MMVFLKEFEYICKLATIVNPQKRELANREARPECRQRLKRRAIAVCTVIHQ